MNEGESETGTAGRRIAELVTRCWLTFVTLIWLGAAAVMVQQRWNMIRWFSLPDTDDNMRMSQVRALLNGQGWYDLRQYKLNPPVGFDMHWSRLVDLPIAAIDLIARRFTDGATAERVAAAIAPMLPLWVAMAAIALLVRRLVAPGMWWIGVGLTTLAFTSLYMFMPMRIDHHGWQLAFLMLAIAGVADEDARRGGIVMGLASAASLVIGLELLPFLTIVGAATVSRWAAYPDDAPRLQAYGLSLAIGSAAGYLMFASYANSVPRCDVLSPVYLSVMVAAGWIAWLLPQVGHSDWRVRLAGAAVGGALLVVGFAILAPQCLGRPEQVSPELYTKWLSNITEAKPLYTKDWVTLIGTAALPMAGATGAIFAAFTARATPRFAVWLPVALISLTSLGLLLWQARMGPAAQLTAIPGATALLCRVVPPLHRSSTMLVRVLGVFAAFLLISGTGPSLAAAWLFPPKVQSARSKAIDFANRRCPTLPAMAPIGRLPATTIFTFVDLGPRLITVTHHKAIAGPYHRNGGAILDVHHAFDGTPDAARAIMLRHGATMLMTCPNLSESTVYRARSPNGFYSQLAAGKRFDWLEPVPLPTYSPLLLWRIKPR